MRLQHILLIFSMLFLVFPADDTAGRELSAREQRLTELFDLPCQKFGIPKPLAMAIARQESSMHPLIVNIAGKDVLASTLVEAIALARQAEARGLSYDVGVMQINSYWIRKYKIPLRLLFDPKENIYMGCWILRQEVKKYGLNWKAVGKYHSPSEERGRRYAQRIRNHLKNILIAYQ